MHIAVKPKRSTKTKKDHVVLGPVRTVMTDENDHLVVTFEDETLAPVVFPRGAWNHVERINEQ